MTEIHGDIQSRLTGLIEGKDGETAIRDDVRQIVDLTFELRCFFVKWLKSRGLKAGSARARLREYFIAQCGDVIESTELQAVAQIVDYPRRIRELRVQEGFRIFTGASPDPFSGIDLKPDQYLLLESEPDLNAANRWQVANTIRRKTSSSRDKILEFLKANLLKVVTTEDLAYVAGDKTEFGRRTRELRTEEGFAIATKFSGRPDLSRGEYILLSADRIAEPHDRHIPDEVQKAVYKRDNNTCRNPDCRYTWTASDPRILELHHIVAHAKRGPNTAENLILLCQYCHDDVHANRLDILRCLSSEP